METTKKQKFFIHEGIGGILIIVGFLVIVAGLFSAYHLVVYSFAIWKCLPVPVGLAILLSGYWVLIKNASDGPKNF